MGGSGMGKLNNLISKFNPVQGIIVGLAGGLILFVTTIAIAAKDHPSYYFGDLIVSINLYDAQGSNRFFSESDFKVKYPADKKFNPIVFFNEGEEVFGYQYIGKTETDIHLLHTYYSGGGSGVFIDIMLVTLIADYGVVFDIKRSIIKATRKRLLIKKLGEISLGDRWSGNLKLDGNNLFIGKDVGRFAGTDSGGRFSEKPKDRVVKIDISH